MYALDHSCSCSENRLTVFAPHKNKHWYQFVNSYYSVVRLIMLTCHHEHTNVRTGKHVDHVIMLICHHEHVRAGKHVIVDLPALAKQCGEATLVSLLPVDSNGPVIKFRRQNGYGMIG